MVADGFGCESLFRGSTALGFQMGTTQGIYPWVGTLSSIVMYNLGGGPRFAYVSASARHQNNKLLW
jgi:hypothetical protein